MNNILKREYLSLVLEYLNSLDLDSPLLLDNLQKDYVKFSLSYQHFRLHVTDPNLITHTNKCLELRELMREFIQ